MALDTDVASCRALAIPEVRTLVCAHLASHELYHASMVNKGWERIATPLLWAELPSLKPLMRLIPTSYVVEAYNTAGRYSFKYLPVAAILPSEHAAKQRSRRLAALVNSLRTTKNDLQGTSEIATAFWLGPTPFSSLARLAVDRYNDFGDDDVKLLSKLFPADLLVLDIRGVNRYSWDLAASFPNLRELFIDGNIQLRRVYPWRFTALTRVKLVIRYSSELMEALARFCPTLRPVELDFRDDGIVYEPSLGGGEGFPALQRLSITGVSSASLTQSILKAFRGRHPMEDVRVHHANVSHFVSATDNYLSVLTGINQFCDPTTLRTLVIFPRARKPSEIPRYSAIPSSYLRPLASLSGLLKLKLVSWHGLTFSDADCAQLPAWWPRIRVL